MSAIKKCQNEKGEAYAKLSDLYRSQGFGLTLFSAPERINMIVGERFRNVVVATATETHHDRALHDIIKKKSFFIGICFLVF